MPELPEVETVRRGLVPAMQGQSIKNVTLNRMDLRRAIDPDFKDRLEGAQVKNLIRRGKYILAFLDNSSGFVLHLGMSGRIHIYKCGESYEAAKHDHVIWDMGDGGRIVFNDPRRFGMLYLISESDWHAHAPFNQMGPEPLSNEFSGQVLYEALRHKRGPIKTLLLDQRVVSGVGNIYACEALYEAGIHPERSGESLEADETECLTTSIRNVLTKAIEAGGSTLKDYKKTDGSLGYFQYSFSVYDREGRSCPACGCDTLEAGCVKRIVQSGRSTFYCSRRQR
ncbi:MAG: bifunctional DNA-formamidopyrimidine glycosylase/DNA-(apurinic or apyrimidinic site) lyase [Alphaproteobacteria bacterium]|nr:bifunctional DNA-formamidopyrimidine glycosylase/DNA-(apurinic or apyrimidinic site) lyase [Alphaproteobacteria bacterium]